MRQEMETEIVIVGAGLVGLAAAVAFTRIGKRVLLLDAKKTEALTLTSTSVAPKDWDARIYAITPANQAWLAELGVWAHVDEARVNAMHAMHLWEQNRPNDADKLALSDEDAHVSRLGLIMENSNLQQALWRCVQVLDIPVMEAVSWQAVHPSAAQVDVQLADGRQIAAKLLIVADGAQSTLRRHLHMEAQIKPFNQLAIVANFLAEKPHGDVARQWFAPHETLALLPLPQHHVSMVWALSTESACALLTLNHQTLTMAVENRVHHVLGNLNLRGEVLSFPLNQIVPQQVIAERVALIGDAAHQVHPMAGQGVNLGFRDVIALQALFAGQHPRQDVGEKSVLRRYERARKADITSMNLLIHGLDGLFVSEQGILRHLRAWGMQQLNAQRGLKRILIQQAVA